MAPGLLSKKKGGGAIMMFYATFNNISVIS